MRGVSIPPLTEDAVQRVQEHFDRLHPSGLGERFYRVLFATHPNLRSLFPVDLSALYEHFTVTLTLVVEHLGRVTAVDTHLRDLGARHLRYGAQPHHYAAVRDVLVRVLAEHSGSDWNEALARDWRLAITMVIVPMLRGAAVETAAIAQMLASEDAVDGL